LSPRGARGEAGGRRDDIPYVRRGLDDLRAVRLGWWSARLQGDRALDDESVRPRILDDQAELSDLRRKGAAAMSEHRGGGGNRVFEGIDPQKLASGALDYSSGEGVTPPPGIEPEPAGLIFDVRLGKHFVRFLFVEMDGVPHTTAIWRPSPPKKLRPELLEKYRRSRKAFAVEISTQFGWRLPIIDRFGGDPRIVEVVHPGGEVERMDPPIAYHEAVLH